MLFRSSSVLSIPPAASFTVSSLNPSAETRELPTDSPDEPEKKAPKKLDLRKGKGRCKDSFAELGYTSVDRFIDDVRGR